MDETPPPPIGPTVAVIATFIVAATVGQLVIEAWNERGETDAAAPSPRSRYRRASRVADRMHREELRELDERIAARRRSAAAKKGRERARRSRAAQKGHVTRKRNAARRK